LITAHQTYVMLGNAPLWDTAAQCHQILKGADVAHALVGGVAVCLHGYQRNTTDLDLLVRSNDADNIRRVLLEAGYEWDDQRVEFRSPDGIPVQFVIAGERAGKGSEVRLPDPADADITTQIEGLPVLALPRLIDSKIACGEANLRRTHRDFADVVELIAHHHLSSSYARYLHKSLRPTFKELVRRAQG
jgi:hypothetical protein